MTCQVKDNSIKHLIKKGAINENRKIISLDKFNEANYQVTEYAVRKYGLKTDGAMLFTNTVTEKIDKRASSYRRNAYYETARAVPNEVLFQELQVLKDQYDNVTSNPTILPKETTKQIKPDVLEFFESNPELATIGTPQQYSQYLDSIFPESKVKDIVYHGTPDDIQEFDKTKSQVSDVLYFSNDKKDAEGYRKSKRSKIIWTTGVFEYNGFRYAYKYDQAKKEHYYLKKDVNIDSEKLDIKTARLKYETTKKEFDDAANKVLSGGKVVSSLLNIKNLYNGIGEDLFFGGSEYFKEKDYDGFITNDDGGRPSIFAVFEPEQIHILGSEQDIEGFKNFVSGRPMFMKTPEVDYSFKLINALDKITRNKFETSKLQGWLNDLQKQGVPTEQIQLFKEVAKPGMTKDEIAAAIAATYSYTIEINTAKTIDTYNYEESSEEENFQFNGIYYSIGSTPEGDVYFKGNKEISKEEYFKDFQEAKKLNKGRPTQFYRNLTVPGGTNYTEQEIATPAITPSIKGHAEFATDKGIGWFRSDDKSIQDYKSNAKNIVELEKDLNRFQTTPIRQGKNENWYIGLQGPFKTESEAKAFKEDRLNKTLSILNSSFKTRRILEIQSDLFQKGRDKKELAKGEINEKVINISEPYLGEGRVVKVYDNGSLDVEYESGGADYGVQPSKFRKVGIIETKNQFLQLLNKDNNWVTFFVKSIIQDSAKQGYEKVLFPSGNTASKVEGHTTLEEFKQEKEDRIKTLEKQKTTLKEIDSSSSEYLYGTKVFKLNKKDGYLKDGYAIYSNRIQDLTEKSFLTKDVTKNPSGVEFTYITIKSEDKSKFVITVKYQENRIDNEINQLKQELERVEGPEGFGALKPIYNFYETTVANILKKQGYTPKQVTDEFGNTWNEVEIKPERDTQSIAFLRQDQTGETIPLVDIDLNTINSARSKEVAEVLAERLSRGLKVDYENITPEDAKNILKNSPVPYRGEPAFYFAGKVYIVGDNVNVHTVLHEFSHPLLQGIRKTNPELFNNLFNQLAGTEEGQGIIDYVKKHYPELNVDGPLFKEEALAFALQLKSLNKVNNQIETEGFDNFINKLLAAIKQMLRGVFGNTVTVSKLDVDTTLDELADMLLEKDFQFETDKVTEEDLVMYGRFVVERADELVKLSNTEAMQKVVNEVFATNKALLIRAKEFKTDKAIRAMVEKALLKEGTTELLPAIAESLKSYQDISVSGKLNSSEIIDNALDAEGKRLDEMKNRAVALVNSLDKINSISKNMMKDLSRIYLEKNINARNTIGLVNLYKNNAYAWQNTIGEINNILEEFDIDTSNPFYQVINEITTNLSKVQTKIADIYKKNNVQFFVEITGYMNEFVNNELKSNLGIALKKAIPEGELEKTVNTLYNSVIQQNLSDAEIEELVTKGVPRDVLEKFIKKYNDYIVNEDKIKEALTGHAKDVSWFNRWLESYSSSNDIIVGPLSMFIQDQKTEVENEVWKKSMEFRKKLETLLPKVGFSKLNSTQIRDMVSGLDTVMTFDKKTGKPVSKEIYTFLNEFNNGWRYTQDLLEYTYEEAKKTGDKDKIAKALTELRQFNTDYMWQEFTTEYYEKDDIFKNSEIGGLAYVAKKQALDEYNNIQNQFDKELERFDNYSIIEGAWRKYQQLYSLYYENGSPKIDDPSKGIHDLSIAKLLLEHRQSTKDFYELIPTPGSLQTSYNEFVTSLEAQNITKGSADFINKLKKWKRQNIKIIYSDEYYAERKRLHARRQELQSRINEVMQSEFDISGAYQTINDLIFSYRDDFNQPNPEELGPKRLKMIRDLEQSILDFKRKFDKKAGLTKEQSAELELLSEKAKRGELNEAESKRYVYLLQLLKKAGINIKEALELKSIFEDLKGMSNKLPTEYYLDALNWNLSELNIEEVDEDNVDNFINTPEFQNLVDSNEKFREWFDLNHVVTYRFNFKTKMEESYYQRSAANSVSLPSNPKYYKTTTIVDTDTNETITLLGVPNSRHSRFDVKDKYRTIPRGAIRQEYVGKYIDNKGNPLPRPFVPGAKNSAKDDRFIDKRYAQLKASNSAEYQLLEAMKEYHLQVQEGQTNYGKLYLDMPRYATKASDVYQIIQRGKYGERYKEMGKNIVEGIKQTFGTSVADNENGYNYNPENNLVNTDMAGNEISYIPVTGVYNLDVEVTDADVLQGLFKYSLSLQTQGKLLESLPLVESVLSTLEDPANKPKNIDRFSKAAFNVRNKLQNTNKQGAENNRLGQVRSLIEREYYGKQVVGLEENYPKLGKWLGVLQKLSSRGSLMLNIPSDIKNQFSGYIQTIIEGSGGEFITLKDIALATPWATKAMLDWTTKGIYQVGPGEMSTQLVEIFDPTFKSEDNFGRSVTRSLAKDLVNGEWLYMHRKFGEMDVAMKLFGSFLHGQKIEQTLSNGKKISIRYVDAWEKDANGIAKLKDGIHPGWNNTAVYHTYTKGETLEEIAKKYYIDVEELQAKNHIKATTQLEDGQEIIIAKSEKFKAFKNKLQGTSRRLFGVYDKFGQPEGNKYIMYRMFFFMRKWFTPMLVNRFGMDVSSKNFGGARYDWALGKTTKGYYVNAFQTLVGLLKSKGSSYAYMTPQEKTDLKRTMSEGLTIIMTALISSALLGFDDDDEDKWKKIAARSEAIGQEGFNTYGFLTNHALLLILGLQAETGAFVPLPKVFGLNLGADDYVKMITSTSSAFYNTAILYIEILGDFLNFITLDDAARYKKDTGPYWWQQKDELKIWKRLFATVGFTGGTGDPETAIKNISKSSGKLR